METPPDRPPEPTDAFTPGDLALFAMASLIDQCTEAAEYEDDFGTPEAAFAFRICVAWITEARRKALGHPDIGNESPN